MKRRNPFHLTLDFFLAQTQMAFLITKQCASRLEGYYVPVRIGNHFELSNCEVTWKNLNLLMVSFDRLSLLA